MLRSVLALTLGLALLLVGLPSPVRADHRTGIREGWACVSQVIDPDTVVVAGLDHRVRLAGIFAPRRGEAFWLESKEVVMGLAFASRCQVWIEPAFPSRDTRTGHYRAYLWFQSPAGVWYLAQEEMVLKGLAWVRFNRFSLDPYAEHLTTAQAIAQAAERGVWAPAE